MTAVDRLFDSANNFHGITLQPAQVREIASVLVGMDREIGRLQMAENVANAYLNEYGEDLLRELVGDGIVEGEVVSDDGDTVQDGTGQTEEAPGVHTQVAEGDEPPVEVSETASPAEGGA